KTPGWINKKAGRKRNEIDTVHCHDSECAADRGVGRRDGACATARRRFHDVQPQQPAEHVDPRGSDASLAGADDGGVQQNLVMFDQHVKQNSLQSIVPDLATSWSWNEEGTELTFPLRQGVRWHDGKPFTARDVQCTWDMLTGKSSEKLRVNPRKGWYRNLAAVTTNGDYEVTFHLNRPQPAFLGLLASGYSPIYPCHVPPRDMRQHPIGTGPFKFVEFKPNEYIKVTRNPDYWKN